MTLTDIYSAIILTGIIIGVLLFIVIAFITGEK